MSARRITLLALVAALILVVGVVAGVGAAPVPFYVSAEAPGTTSDGLDYGPEDILYKAGNWGLHFDGSTYGFTSEDHEIDAFSIDWNDGWTYMSFNNNRTRVPGVGGWVYGHDIVKHDDWYGGFSYVFDGSDVGLTLQGERIAGLFVIYESGSQTDWGWRADPTNCPAGEILISPVGRGKIPSGNGFNGQPINFSGEDVLWFCAQNLGQDTQGLFLKYFDGMGDDPDAIYNPNNPMPNRSLWALGTGSLGPWSPGSPVWFFTRDTFIVPNAFGGYNQLYRWEAGSGDFENGFFNADTAGLNGKVTGMHRWPDAPLTSNMPVTTLNTQSTR